MLLPLTCWHVLCHVDSMTSCFMCKQQVCNGVCSVVLTRVVAPLSPTLFHRLRLLSRLGSEWGLLSGCRHGDTGRDPRWAVITCLWTVHWPMLMMSRGRSVHSTNPMQISLSMLRALWWAEDQLLVHLLAFLDIMYFLVYFFISNITAKHRRKTLKINQQWLWDCAVSSEYR